jgi:hypothetical protein
MPGIGGTLGFADPEYAFAFALTKNRLTGPAAGPGVTARAVDAARAALGIPEG